MTFADQKQEMYKLAIQNPIVLLLEYKWFENYVTEFLTKIKANYFKRNYWQAKMLRIIFLIILQ